MTKCPGHVSDSLPQCLPYIGKKYVVLICPITLCFFAKWRQLDADEYPQLGEVWRCVCSDSTGQ